MIKTRLQVVRGELYRRFVVEGSVGEVVTAWSSGRGILVNARTMTPVASVDDWDDDDGCNGVIVSVTINDNNTRRIEVSNCIVGNDFDVDAIGNHWADGTDCTDGKLCRGTFDVDAYLDNVGRPGRAGSSNYDDFGL